MNIEYQILNVEVKYTRNEELKMLNKKVNTKYKGVTFSFLI